MRVFEFTESDFPDHSEMEFLKNLHADWFRDARYVLEPHEIRFHEDLLEKMDFLLDFLSDTDEEDVLDDLCEDYPNCHCGEEDAEEEGEEWKQGISPDQRYSPDNGEGGVL